MVIVAPSVAEFKARYAAFENVSDTRVSLFLADGVGGVNEDWADADIPRGIMAYAAHLLTLDGEPARSDATANGSSSSASDGVVKKYTVGDVTLEYDTSRESMGGQGTGTGLDDTFYGRIYLELARRNTVTLLVV